MKKRILLIINILTVYMAAVCGCSRNNDGVGSEGIAINPDGTPVEQSDAAASASTQEEAKQDPKEYLDPAIDILGWKCVNDVAAGKAIGLIDQALEIDDSLVEAYKGRGSAYLCLGDSIANFDSAEADFIKMQKLEPDNPDGYLGQAEVLIRKGKKDEAIELLEKAKELLIAGASSSTSGTGSSDNAGTSGTGSSEDSTGTSGAEADGTSVAEAGNGEESDNGSAEDSPDGSADGSSQVSSDDAADGSDQASSDSTADSSSDGQTDGSSENASGDDTTANDQARYNSGISEIFMTTEADIQLRIDELNSDTYSDSKGRVRYTTIYAEDGAVMESLFYACYMYGEDDSDIIVSYNAEGSMIATVFNLYEGTDKYVYGMYTGSDTWNVCIPLWSDDGVMTGIETVYGGSAIAYDMYLYDSEGTMIGTEQYSSSKSLENTVYFDGYSADSATNGGEGVTGTPSYTIEDIYALLGEFI